MWPWIFIALLADLLACIAGCWGWDIALLVIFLALIFGGAVLVRKSRQ
jgi:hypothetical protein